MFRGVGGGGYREEIKGSNWTKEAWCGEGRRMSGWVGVGRDLRLLAVGILSVG